MNFCGVRGLRTSSYILYDYTTSGHEDTIGGVCMYIYIYIYIHLCTVQYIHFYTVFIYDTINM